MGRVREAIKRSLRDRIKLSQEEIAKSELRISELKEDISEAQRYLAKLESDEKSKK